MIKALVSIDADLPSSIALRYTCQLAKLKDVEIQTIHIHAPEAAGASIGTGWARRTYEKELIEDSRREISQLLIAESGFCPVLKPPLILSGDREKEILEEVRKGGYHLFVEGSPVQTGSKGLSKHLRSHLYQHLPVPALLVQNLFPLRRVILAVAGGKDLPALFKAFGTIFEGVELELDLLQLGSGQGTEGDELEASARKMAADYGYTILKVYPFADSVEKLARQVEECSLMATLVARQGLGKVQQNTLLELLGRLACPALFCWQ